MRYRALIFDFDGVILESADIKTEAFTQLFADYPEHADAIRRHHLDNVGVSRFEKFRWIYDTLLMKPLVAEESQWLGQRFSELAFSRILSCDFVPGAQQLLAAAYGRAAMYVVSGTPQNELDQVVDQRGLRGYFQSTLGTPPEKTANLKRLLNEEKIATDAAVYIGDGVSDYHAAVSAGIPFIARRTPAFADEWLTRQVPVADDLFGVMELVELMPAGVDE
jgi:phosphoglycolate phosphatase-like HAD superfamily hydrolase